MFGAEIGDPVAAEHQATHGVNGRGVEEPEIGGEAAVPAQADAIGIADPEASVLPAAAKVLRAVEEKLSQLRPMSLLVRMALTRPSEGQIGALQPRITVPGPAPRSTASMPRR